MTRKNVVYVLDINIAKIPSLKERERRKKGRMTGQNFDKERERRKRREREEEGDQRKKYPTKQKLSR